MRMGSIAETTTFIVLDRRIYGERIEKIERIDCFEWASFGFLAVFVQGWRVSGDGIERVERIESTFSSSPFSQLFQALFISINPLIHQSINPIFSWRV